MKQISSLFFNGGAFYPPTPVTLSGMQFNVTATAQVSEIAQPTYTTHGQEVVSDPTEWVEPT